MLSLLRTNSQNKDFQSLVQLLDRHLQAVDGDDHPFFAQYNKIDRIQHAVVAYLDGKAVGCGAFKEYEQGVVEIKRMYVMPDHQGAGIGFSIVAELEKWAKECSYSKAILETGRKMEPAIRLYRRAGYAITENYGQYAGVELSVCMEKVLG